MTAPARSPILRALRLGLHALFAVLLVLGVARTFLPAAGPLLMHYRLVIVVLVAVLALVYVLGTSREYRSHRAAAELQASRPVVWGWLASITALWLALLFFSPAFVWVAFPLMFLYLHLLSTVPGIIAVVLLWTATWAFPWWEAVRATGPQPPEMSTILGPGIGAVLAVLISAAYRYLLDQANHYQRVADALRAAQVDLAATDHRAGQLEERERLAREIHDTLAQGFSSILLLSRAANQHRALPEPTRRALETIEETAATNLAEARDVVRHLATADPSVSLMTELKRLTARYDTELALRKQPVDMTLRWEGNPPDTLPEPIRSAVVRTVQVGLGNIAAHAHATRVVITIGSWPAELTVDIYDDGVGFDVPNVLEPGFARGAGVAEHTGYGLYGLQQRLTALKGTLSLSSTPGEGTVVTAQIPLTSQTARIPQETP